MCSSDRKRFIVLQVKTMSSHQRAAGTRQWKSRLGSSGCSAAISSAIGSPQSGHEDSTRPSTWSAAQMPSASQAQFAYHQRPPALDAVRGRHERERVEHADLGGRRIEDEGVASCRRRRAAELGLRKPSGRRGACPVSTKSRYDAVAELDVALVHAPSLVAFARDSGAPGALCGSHRLRRCQRPARSGAGGRGAPRGAAARARDRAARLREGRALRRRAVLRRQP